MKILGIIALLTLLPSTECVHPQYSFRCLEDGEIDLFGIHNSSKIISLNGAGSCKNTDVHQDPKKQYYIIPSTCAENTTIRNNRNVTIVINDPEIDKDMPSTKHPTTTPIGGRGTHGFNFVCKGIPDRGVNKTVVHVFQNKLNNVLPENNVDVDGVEMRFKAFQDVNSPDIDTIFVGDEFFMYIKYLGKQNYSVVPKKCSANSGTVLDKEPHVDLWNQINVVNCTPHEELLELFKPVKRTLVFAKMFGFRFSDSEYITINCEVGIFSGEADLCPTSNTGRRRRGIESVEVKTKFPVSKIRVFDNKIAYRLGNNSHKNSVNIFVWIISLFCILIYLW